MANPFKPKKMKGARKMVSDKPFKKKATKSKMNTLASKVFNA